MINIYICIVCVVYAIPVTTKVLWDFPYGFSKADKIAETILDLPQPFDCLLSLHVPSTHLEFKLLKSPKGKELDYWTLSLWQ